MADTSGPALGHALLRVLLGLNFFGHGFGRLTSDWPGFVRGVEAGFAGTWMPAPLVTAFAWSIVPVEIVLGLLLMLGLFQRAVLVVGGLFLGALIFGNSVRQEWATIRTQMIFAVCFYLLLLRLCDDRFSLDAKRRQLHAAT